MQQATQAYSKTATQTATPRDLEATLLVKAAKKLQDIQQHWDSERDALNEALIYNRKLWTVFVGAVAEDDHPLPQEIKNNIASLGVFIFRQIVEIQDAPTPDKLDALISINREIAAGLRGRA